jgi:hypothetical protein
MVRERAGRHRQNYRSGGLGEPPGPATALTTTDRELGELDTQTRN